MAGVEIGQYQKSSFSGSVNDCLEVAVLDDGGRRVRNSKRPDGAHVDFTASEWTAFVKGVGAGEFGD